MFPVDVKQQYNQPTLLEEWIPFEEMHPPEKKTRIHVVSLCKTDKNYGDQQVNITLFLEKRQGTFISELQIRGGIEDISKIIFLISQRKHML